MIMVINFEFEDPVVPLLSWISDSYYYYFWSSDLGFIYLHHRLLLDFFFFNEMPFKQFLDRNHEMIWLHVE
jgi:hypothetical protein